MRHHTPSHHVHTNYRHWDYISTLLDHNPLEDSALTSPAEATLESLVLVSLGHLDAGRELKALNGKRTRRTYTCVAIESKAEVADFARRIEEPVVEGEPGRIREASEPVREVALRTPSRARDGWVRGRSSTCNWSVRVTGDDALPGVLDDDWSICDWSLPGLTSVLGLTAANIDLDMCAAISTSASASAEPLRSPRTAW